MTKQDKDASPPNAGKHLTAPKPTCGTVRNARVVEPLSYWSGNGKQLKIPVGPCLVEEMAGAHAEIIWGASGQNSAGISQKDVDAAERSGALLMLD